MSFENLPIYICLILTLIGIIFSVLRLKSKNSNYISYARFITILLFVVITFTLIYLYYLFLVSDISIDYVWRHCSNDLALQYKFAGVLAGMAGSLLFWIWAIITPWFIEEIKTLKYSLNKKNKKSVDLDTLDWTRIFLFMVIFVLLFILNLHDIFKPTSSANLLASPNGSGLNPLLQTELMILHPPIVFLAYGFLAIPFAAAFANLITGSKDWLSFSINWSRLGWIFLTLGIGIGALWAYIVLGWGGYWGWDPVETSSLIPWILLTCFLHVQLMYKRKNDYRLLAPIIGIFSFILVIFATFVTRAGGIWVSVHTFGEAQVSIDPLQRFTNILMENFTVLTYFIFMVICLIITGILVFYRYKRFAKEKIGSKERFYSLSEMISDEILMLATIVLFVITTLVTFILLNIGVNGWDPDVFNNWVGLFSFLLLFVLIICLLWKYAGRKMIAVLGVCILISSIICFFITSFHIAFASLPILAFSLIGAIYKSFKSFNIKRPWKSMRIVSAHIIHIAIVLIVIGYVSSTYFVEEKKMYLTAGGYGDNIGEYTIKLVSGKSTLTEGYVVIEVWKGNELIGQEKPGWILLDDQTRNEIKIVDTLFDDVYLIYQQAYGDNPEIVESVDIEVKILPLMKILWLGMWLLAIGMLLRIASEITTRGEVKIESLKKYKKAQKSKDDKYYENILEDELRK
jgi:cytochrome c-type biogenesis protein CcmF